MSESERKNDGWKLGVLAGGAAIIAGLGYYLGTQSQQANTRHCYSHQESNDSGSSASHHTHSNPHEKCSICLSKMKPVQRLNCGHTFHTDCISGWLPENSTCPICRQSQE